MKKYAGVRAALLSRPGIKPHVKVIAEAESWRDPIDLTRTLPNHIEEARFDCVVGNRHYYREVLSRDRPLFSRRFSQRTSMNHRTFMKVRQARVTVRPFPLFVVELVR